MIMDRIYYNEYASKRAVCGQDPSCYANLNVRVLKKFLGYYETMVNKYNLYEQGFINNLLYDISTSLIKCGFTDVQDRRLRLWLRGYSEKEIAEMEGVSRWVVSKSITAACNKLLSILQEL